MFVEKGMNSEVGKIEDSVCPSGLRRNAGAESTGGTAGVCEFVREGTDKKRPHRGRAVGELTNRACSR